MMTAYSNYVSLHKNLFRRIKYVYENQDQHLLTTEQQMLLEKTYLNFIRSGANLEEEDRRKYETLTQELSTLSLTFKENILKATNLTITHHKKILI